MAGSIFRVNKSVGKSIEFKGLKAQYIWILAGGVVGCLMLFAILYIAGVNQYICIVVILGLGSAVVSGAFRLSKKFGEHGLMKWQARRGVPKHLRAHTRKHFLKQIGATAPVK
jgi:hypothetical protein